MSLRQSRLDIGGVQGQTAGDIDKVCRMMERKIGEFGLGQPSSRIDEGGGREGHSQAPSSVLILEVTCKGVGAQQQF